MTDVEQPAEFTLPEGEQVFLGEVANPMLCVNMNDWYCTNRPNIYEYFNIPSGFNVDEAQNAMLSMSFAPWAGSRKHNVYVYMNGHLIGSIIDIIPTGTYIFDFNASYINDAETGVSSNTIYLHTVHMNGGHYVLAANFKVCVCLESYGEYVVAESQEEANDILWDKTYLTPSASNLTVNITSPLEGAEILCGTPTLIRANVTGDGGPALNLLVKATFNNSDYEIVLVDDGMHDDGVADDGIYAGTWTPMSTNNTTITVTASNCAVSAEDCVNVTIVSKPENRYALIIAVDSADIPSVYNGAEAFKMLLKSGYNYKSENIIFIDYSDATYLNILSKYWWLIGNSDWGKNPLVYYHTGHGYGAPIIGEGIYTKDFPNCITDIQLSIEFNSVNNIGMIIDSCNSGGLCLSTDTSLDLGHIFGLNQEILMSCPDWYSETIEDLEPIPPYPHSRGTPFTYYLIKGFTLERENVGKNGNGRVSLSEAFEYAKPLTSAHYNEGATPVMQDTFIGDFYLSDYPIGNYWGVSTNCLVVLHAFDQGGNHTGLIKEGILESNIPRSFYNSISDEQMIILFDPSQLDEIKFEIEAFDEGEFDLILKQFVDGNMGSKAFRNVQITNDSIGHINMSHKGIENILSLDIDGDSVIDKYIESSGIPFAKFVYSPNFLTVNETITFDASYSTDLDGTIESLEWNFSDGTTGGGKITTHNYTSAGVYNVMLTVTDNNGTQDTCTETITVIKPDGGVEVTVDPQSRVVTPGSTLELNVKINSTENFNDIFGVYLSPEDIPPDQQINFTWFDWVGRYATIPAGEVNTTPLNVTIPANATCGIKTFKVVVESVIWTGNASSDIVNITITGGLKGDLNRDGTLTPADAAIALRLAASGAHDDAADVSSDNHVTSLDALMILQAAAGAIEL